MNPLTVALLTTDDRQMLRQYSAPQPIFGTAVHALLQGFANQAGLELHVLSCVQQPVQAPEKLAGNIWFHSLVVPKLGWLRSGYIGCIRAVRARLASIRPAIVHGQGTERECAMCAVWSGYPNVLTIHGLMGEMARGASAPLGSFLWCAARLESHVLRRTHGVFCNSSFTESVVRPLAPSTSSGQAPRVWRVPNPVRKEFFAPRPPAARPAPPVLLNVGHIGANKRQAELLELARRLHARGHQFTLRFLGRIDANDAYAAEFRARSQKAAQEGFASYEGLKLNQELIDCFDNASALVHFPKVETFGLAVAEALARGLKLFGNRCGGVVDVGQDAEGAELLELEDLPGLEERLAHWLDTGAPMPADPGAHVRERYHPDVVARRHLEIYQEFLLNRRAPA